MSPHIVGAWVIERWKTGVAVRLRTNAMGSWTRVEMRLKDADGGSVTSVSASVGKQEVARDAVVRIEGLRPGVEYSGEAIAKNDHGESNKYPVNAQGSIPVERI